MFRKFYVAWFRRTSGFPYLIKGIWVLWWKNLRGAPRPPKPRLVVVAVRNLRDLPSTWWSTTTKWILYVPLPPICIFWYDIRDFYRALPIFLCSTLMCVYDIPMSYWYPVVWLFCCFVASPRPCLACILALQSWSLRPHIPFHHNIRKLHHGPYL